MAYYNMLLLTTLFSVICLSSYSDSLMFELHPNTQRCLREAIDKNDIIIGDFNVTPSDHVEVNYVIRDSQDHILAQHSNVHKGKFTFSTDVPEVYEICFISKMSSQYHSNPQEVKLDIRSGIEAKSYDQLMESGKLKPLEVELRKLEDLSNSIVDDFENMRKQEAQMRNTNESTNTRVFYLSMFIMLFVVFISGWQLFHLHRYFKSRKLID